MAWVKIPVEHHPIFMAAVPKDPRVTTLKMFGGIAAKVNGHMFAGLFAKSFIVKLSDADREEALQLDGAELFDPMGNGRIMKDTVFMPEETFGEDAELKRWLVRALEHTAALPAKAESEPAREAAPAVKASASKAKATTTKPPVAKPATKPAATTKPATKHAATTKPATTKPAAAKPSAAKPSAAKPSTAKPSAAKPSAAKPSTAKPASTKPETKSSATKFAAKKPVTTKRK